MPRNHEKLLEALAQRIGHAFSSLDLLERAVTHASFSKGRRRALDYERLEFLGDRVLGLIIADLLFRLYPDASEGELAPRLNALVRKETCAEVARALDLGSVLRLGPGEVTAGGRKKEAILANACEAVIAAVYLDGGLDAACRFVERSWEPHVEAVTVKPKDPKSAVQEWAQGRGLPAPEYEEMARSGPDHAPRFSVRIVIEGRAPAEGEGATKRAAEQAAAETFLRREGIGP